MKSILLMSITLLLSSCENLELLLNEETGNSSNKVNACLVDSLQCTHWFDASEKTNLFTNPECTDLVSGNGESVRCWKNQGSSSNDNLDLSELEPLEYRENGIDPLIPAVYSAQNTALQFTNFKPVNTGTWFFVLNIYQVFTEGHIMGQGDGGANVTTLKVNNSGVLEMIHGDNSITDFTQVSLDQRILVTVKFDGEHFNFYVNGEHIGSNALGTIDSSRPFCLGCINNGFSSPGPDFDIHELVFYSEVLSDDQITMVHKRLAEKWNLLDVFL